MKTLILKIRFFLSAAALITIILPVNLSAANLHAIIAGDTLDSSIGTSVKIDIKQVKNEQTFKDNHDNPPVTINQYYHRSNH